MTQWSSNGENTRPDRGPPAPRIAVWLRPGGDKAKTGGEFNAYPCTPDGEGVYGCSSVVAHSGMEPIDFTVPPDTDGEERWEFVEGKNPRPTH